MRDFTSPGAESVDELPVRRFINLKGIGTRVLEDMYEETLEEIRLIHPRDALEAARRNGAKAIEVELEIRRRHSVHRIPRLRSASRPAAYLDAGMYAEKRRHLARS